MVINGPGALVWAGPYKLLGSHTYMTTDQPHEGEHARMYIYVDVDVMVHP